jgi:hypothetical protein
MAKRTMWSISIDLKANELVIRAPLTIPPESSKTGKTLVLATTHGPVRTGAKFDGKTITIGVNAYVPVKQTRVIEAVDADYPCRRSYSGSQQY